MTEEPIPSRVGSIDRPFREGVSGQRDRGYADPAPQSTRYRVPARPFDHLDEVNP